MLLTLVIINLIVSSISLYLIFLSKKEIVEEVIKDKVELRKHIPQGREYHTCEYCRLVAPNVRLINGHYVCTSQICHNHVGAA